MDSYIRKLKVESLFGTTTLNIDFDERVNCVYGPNGSGKTTVINLLVAALSADATKLSLIDFKKIIIYSAASGTRRALPFLEVQRSADKAVTFRLPQHGIERTLSASRRDTPGLERREGRILETLKSVIKLTYVPLTRMLESEIYDQDRYEDIFVHRALRSRHFSSTEISGLLDPSRRMLNRLEDAFKEEFSRVQTLIAVDTEKLKNRIVSKILIDRGYVDQIRRFLPTAEKRYNLEKELLHQPVEVYIDKLKSANINLPESAILEHFSLVDDLRDRYLAGKAQLMRGEESTDADRQYYVNTLFEAGALAPIYKRFVEILDDIQQSEKNKQELLSVFDTTQKIVNDFFINKKFNFSAKGDFSITCGDRTIKIEDLSSGEKHMIALLGRVALSPREGSVFVADEPELSLHLEWQRKMLPAISRLSPKMQVIVATHSPAIIPDNARMIDLESCEK